LPADGAIFQSRNIKIGGKYTVEVKQAASDDSIQRGSLYALLLVGIPDFGTT
jgi:hypothetical protein